MSKIHVIGANGYIGALLVNYLLASGHIVEVSSYRLPNIPLKSIDANIVIHLAVSGGGTEHKPRAGENDPEQMRKINIGGMKALMAGLANPRTKIIFLSSTAVYGKFTDSPLVDEKTELAPVSEYGRQKVESENILRNSHFEWLIIRPCGIFGLSAGNRLGNSFLNILVANAIQKGQITILGGDQKIDTLYILDLIHVILRSCSNDWKPREIFNVGGEIVTVEEMLQTLAASVRNLGIPCSVSNRDFVPSPAILTNIHKLKQAFPEWRNTPLNISIHALVTNYLTQYKQKSSFF